jgi:hypothetical protein
VNYLHRALLGFLVGSAAGAMFHKVKVDARLDAIEEVVMSTSAGIAELETRLDSLSSRPDNPSPERED